jgi:hypothetical protein
MKLCFKAFLFMLTLFLMFNLTFCQWSLPLTANFGGTTQNVTIGTNSFANDGLDTFDVITPPPGPGSIVCYFVCPSCPPGIKLKTDIRAIADTVVWQFGCIGVTAPSIQFMWRTDSLPRSLGIIQFDTTAAFTSPINIYLMRSISVNTSVALREQAYFRFIDTTSTVTRDTIPPYAINFSPECGDTNVSVSLDTVHFDVLDDDSSIDTIEVLFNGIYVTSSLLLTPITDGFHVKFAIPIVLAHNQRFWMMIFSDDSVGNRLVDTCDWRTVTIDTIPPYAINFSPECGDTNVPVSLDTVHFDVLDDSSGIDTITVWFDGTDITSSLLLTPITNGFHVEFAVPIALAYKQWYDTRIVAYDNDSIDSIGNVIDYTCRWRTADSSLIKEHIINIPKTPTIEINPNPFNRSCRIVSHGADLIEIVDINGRIVSEFKGENFVWEPKENVSSGIYFVSASVKGKIINERVFFVK